MSRIGILVFDNFQFDNFQLKVSIYVYLVSIPLLILEFIFEKACKFLAFSELLYIHTKFLKRRNPLFKNIEMKHTGPFIQSQGFVTQLTTDLYYLTAFYLARHLFCRHDITETGSYCHLDHVEICNIFNSISILFVDIPDNNCIIVCITCCESVKIFTKTLDFPSYKPRNNTPQDLSYISS